MSSPGDESEDALTALLERRKAVCARIGRCKSRGEPTQELIREVARLSEQIESLKSKRRNEQNKPEAIGVGSLKTLQPAAADVFWVCDVPGIDALRADWADLVRRARIDSPYLTWEWVSSWYEAYREEGDIRCMTCRDTEGRLVGLAPLFLSRPGRLRQRVISFASSLGRSSGFYLGLACDADYARTVAAHLVAQLDRMAGEWDLLQGLRLGARSENVWELASAFTLAGYRPELARGSDCAVMHLPATPERVLESLSSASLRRNCLYGARRLKKDHPDHSFERCLESTDVERRLGELISLNVRMRQHRGKSDSIYVNETHQRCFLEAMRRFAASGWLEIVTLTVGGSVAGIQPMWVFHDRLYLHSPAWSPEYRQYEISHQLFIKALELGVRLGAREADFLRISTGQDYKLRYAQEKRPTFHLTVRHDSGWPGRIGRWVETSLRRLSLPAFSSVRG